MKLFEIKNKVLSLPTIMSISDAILIINELMSIGFDDLVNDKDVFISIVRDVELAFTDSGFMELTRENEGEFIRFYHWLKDKQTKFNLELNNNIIESFNLTVDEIKQFMI